VRTTTTAIIIIMACRGHNRRVIELNHFAVVMLLAIRWLKLGMVVIYHLLLFGDTGIVNGSENRINIDLRI
jgi:hypothetical protein